MDNPRPEKVAAVEEVKERFSSASSVMVTEYRGLSVTALSELRVKLRESGGYYKVYKNTLVRRAADEAGLDFKDHLLGPTALTFTEKKPDGSEGDVVTVAKTLRDFGKAHPELVIKGGYFDGEVIDAEGINQLADVEPREVLLAKFAGLLAAPMQQFAGLLQALPRDFAYGLQALIEKGGAPGAPESEPAPVEAAVEADAAEADAAEADAAEKPAAAEDSVTPETETDNSTPEATEQAAPETTPESTEDSESKPAEAKDAEAEPASNETKSDAEPETKDEKE